jgi:hypothetical protein
MRVFELANGGKLSLQIRSGVLYFVNLSIVTAAGEAALNIVDNSVLFDATAPLVYESRPGRFLLPAPVSDEYLPAWALGAIRRMEPSYATGPTITLLDLSVDAPGSVSCKGLWASDDTVIVATDSKVIVAKPPDFVSAFSDFSVDYKGPIGPALFDTGKMPALFGFNTGTPKGGKE